MRFSAIAVSAAIFGVAMAVPTVVYETDVVTIISCAPEKTDCPGRAHSSTTLAAVATSSAYSSPVIPTTSAMPVPSSSYSSSSSSSGSSYFSYHNATAPASHSQPTAYTSVTLAAVASSVKPTTYAWAPSASAGIPSAPANTSSPVTPTTPPSFEGAASIKGFSFAAVVMAAAALVLA